MKTLIAIILSLSLLAAQAQTNDMLWQKYSNYDQPHTDGLVVVCFVVGCAILGCIIIWKVKGCTPDQHAPVQFVLEKTYDCGTWTPLCTNTIILNGTNAIDLFSAEIKRDGDSIAFYRARWLKP